MTLENPESVEKNYQFLCDFLEIKKQHLGIDELAAEIKRQMDIYDRLNPESGVSKTFSYITVYNAF